MAKATSDGGIIILPTIHASNNVMGGVRIGPIIFKAGIKYIMLGRNYLREFRR